MLICVISAALIGILAGFWVSLLSGSIEIFENYIDGIWRYQFEVRSAAELIIGAVVGALSGANIRLALSSDRADGFLLGAVIGSAAAILLILGQAVLVLISALLQEYNVEYGFLATRFSGIITVAVLIGAAAGLLMGKTSLTAATPDAAVGILATVSFALPGAISAVLSTPDWSMYGGIFILQYLTTTHLPTLIASICCGALLAAAHRRMAKTKPGASSPVSAIGIMLGIITAITASSSSFHYVILGQTLSADFALSLDVHILRTIVGLLGGAAVGLGIIFANWGVSAVRSRR